MFTRQDLEVYTDSVVFYVMSKPWMTSEVQALIRAHDTAYRSGDRTLYRGARANLKTGIKAAKQDYRLKIESHFQNNNNKANVARTSASNQLQMQHLCSRPL